MTRAQADMDILNKACRYLGKPIKGIPYKGISLKEAQAFIGYPEVKLGIKGLV